MTLSSSTSLLVPLTFSSVLQTSSSSELSSTPETSYYRSQPCVMKSWGVQDDSSPLTVELEGRPIGGVVIGSKDGTLYVFSESRPTAAAVEPQQPTSQHSRPTSPLFLESRATSRDSVRSATSAPFNVTPRARIVSGVTAEQVEAPKNYVDFDDEPDKLKDMLNGRSPRESKETSNGSDANMKSPTSSFLGPPKGNAKRSGAIKPSLSTAELSFVVANSTSSPSRGHAILSHDLTLRCHILPPQCGQGNAVASVRLLDDNESLAVLQERGDLSIISLQDGRCLATITVEHVRIKPPDGIKDRDVPHDVFVWSHLEVYYVGECTILLASATVDPYTPSASTLDIDDNGVLERSQLAMFEYANDELVPLHVRLSMIGQWYFDGLAHGVGVLQEPDSMHTFFSINPKGHFIVRNLRLLPRVPAQMEAPVDAQPMNLTIPLPNPFKASKSHNDPTRLIGKDRITGRIALDEESDLGELIPGGSLLGLRTHRAEGRVLGIAWSSQQLTAFYYQDRAIRISFVDPVIDVKDLELVNDRSYILLFEDRAEYHIIEIVDLDNNHLDAMSTGSRLMKPERIRTIPIGPHNAADITSFPDIITAITTEAKVYKLTRFDATEENRKPHTLWQVAQRRLEISREHEVTSRLPLELDVIIEGYSDGHIRQSSLIEMCGPSQRTSRRKMSTQALQGHITGLHPIYHPRTKEKLIIGGADDGSVAFWTTENFKLCAQWTVFLTPLASVLQIDERLTSPLSGCVLCISIDGTIAVIAIDGFQFLYLIPGAATPLCRVCLETTSLLLIYANRRARLWDIQTMEFRRSISLDKVGELLDQGGWTELSPSENASVPNTLLKPVPGSSVGIDAASTLVLDLQRFTSEYISVAKKISTNRDQTRSILLTLDRLRSVLSALLTPGLNEDIDGICYSRLGIQLSPKPVGFASHGSIALYNNSHSCDPWCISNDVSATRALSIIVLLRALSLFEEYMESANTVMIFYATSLSSSVGPYYKPPSLVCLAKQWFDGSNEVRQAARFLFDYAAACMSDEETTAITDQWQHHLPCLQPSADREATHAALALFLCGYLASEKYSLLSTSALTDISKSIALYLHDEHSLHRVLAVDLCSRGFHIWQHYIDAMEILRALLSLATTPRKEAISVQNVGAQARLAILQIASSNTALFMTTLGLDILTPPSLEHRRSVMQVVAFLIRKRPLVLQPNIPKLMEVVVKSLDPNATTHREAVLDTATEIIGHVVNTFPTVDFHMATQRLAVGSSDGAIVMYDLKTAIRLYVLEQHSKPVMACSFSPDGRRLLSLSLEESVVLVWKVGSSFTSFFNPGAPPRQGHGGSQPYKTISFNVGDAANMSVAETLEFVKVEWIADRSVRVKIKESILTFNT